MPIALVIIGLVMVITGVKNTHGDLGAQLKTDFTGPGNFTYWVVAIVAIGSLGYSKTLRPFSHGFLALVFLVIVLKNGGVFDKLKSALATGPVANPAKTAAAIDAVPVKDQSAGTGSNSSGISAGDVAQLAMFLV